LLPPESPRVLTRSLVVSDEKDERLELPGMASGAPTLLLPIFTRCGGACPMTALRLKEALAKARASFRVVVLSFDAGDAAKDLADFRRRFGLPAEWFLVRGSDGAATRAFLDEIDFHFMKAGGGFDHPNQTFVFSPGGAWAATIAGTAFTTEELEAGYRSALAADDPTVFGRLGRWLARPEAWIVLACAGMAVSLVPIVLLARKSRERLPRPVPRPGERP
jgi:cytochrome oxidase Cu insertion factor (SCO1/SenC/PrrC family)